jgi:hypothetical protein
MFGASGRARGAFRIRKLRACEARGNELLEKAERKALTNEEAGAGTKAAVKAGLRRAPVGMDGVRADGPAENRG